MVYVEPFTCIRCRKILKCFLPKPSLGWKIEFWVAWGWVNNQEIFIFRWTIKSPLSYRLRLQFRRVNCPACSPIHQKVMRCPICSCRPPRTDICGAPGQACVPVPTQNTVSRQITGQIGSMALEVPLSALPMFTASVYISPSYMLLIHKRLNPSQQRL